MTEIDHRYGRILNANLRHCRVPVNTDIHSIKTIFVEVEDTIVNTLCVKGMGELGMVGEAVARRPAAALCRYHLGRGRKNSG